MDRNGFQADVATEDLIPLRAPRREEKFHAFGWAALRIDGHDFDSIERGLAPIPIDAGRPSAVIADTVRGKGLPSLTARADRWFCNFTSGEIEMLLDELEGTRRAVLASETIGRASVVYRKYVPLRKPVGKVYSSVQRSHHALCCGNQAV